MSPEEAIIDEKKVGEFIVLTIDTAKAKYKGRNWKDMGDFGKRKFENYLVITRKYRTKFVYV